MRDVVRAALIIIVLSGAFGAAPVAAGPFEDGLAAAKRGDYATAFQLWRPLAEQGHAITQANVGVMYYEGRGVTQDYAEAVKWYRRAAEQGGAGAQHNLGVTYANGQGVPQDYVQAHMWFELAAARGNKGARKHRDTVAKEMTPAQVAEAQRLAREWRPK